MYVFIKRILMWFCCTLLPLNVESFHFFFDSPNPIKCFTEEVAEETTVNGFIFAEVVSKDTAEVIKQDTKPAALKLLILDPNQKHMVNKDLKLGESKFTFIGNEPGDYKICLVKFIKSLATDKKLKVTFKILEDMTDEEMVEMASIEKYNQLELRIRTLLDQTKKINKELAYQEFREKKFRRMSTHTNQLVLYWAFAQTVVACGVAFWQMKSLKKFLMKKKLI